MVIPIAATELCPEHVIENGEVQGKKQKNSFIGEITCNVGYSLVPGNKTIKCINGECNQIEIPVCSGFITSIDSCSELPSIKSGRTIPIQSSKYIAYRFKCNTGFKRFGESRTECIRSRWSHKEMPFCTKPTSDQLWMLDIPNGEGRALMGGAVYKYRCNPGLDMTRGNTVICEDGNWNGTVPHCNVKPEEPKLDVPVSGQNRELLKPGDQVLVTYETQGGYPVPDIGITVDGVPAGTKDFMRTRNSYVFTATEKDDGKRIACTAVNKVGSSIAADVLKIYKDQDFQDNFLRPLHTEEDAILKQEKITHAFVSQTMSICGLFIFLNFGFCTQKIF